MKTINKLVVLTLASLGLQSKAIAADCPRDQAVNFKNPSECVSCKGKKQTKQDGVCYEIKCGKNEVVVVDGEALSCDKAANVERAAVSFNTGDSKKVVFKTFHKKRSGSVGGGSQTGASGGVIGAGALAPVSGNFYDM
jgi:hypothetical protein